jgi:WD40 repeat protein
MFGTFRRFLAHYELLEQTRSMSQSFQSTREIFTEALEIDDLTGRAEFLAQACGTNLRLRKEVEELLQAEIASGKFLPARPADTSVHAFFDGAVRNSAPDGDSIVSSVEKPGDRIGRYKLVHQIGEGGCGIVYLAEQQEPIRRQVALKVIKLGMDTKSVIARFEAERQALALMDHANIAKVLDAGATETGRPFFVMELVTGPRITEYCEQHQLSTRARVELFLHVCHAVQHAHQKGIIHRDLKPSNILVAAQDGEPVPKVIDFGIAKAMEGRLTDQTIFTGFQHFIGTPAYMSPEQAAMANGDIDTRSDIYSLGVLLYEMLTGHTPFDTRELLASGLDKMRETIREREPKRPSTRLTQHVSARPSEEMEKFARSRIAELRGDLDWIVLKCLEKDRSRRYESASALAADLERHLKDEPILAGAPGNLYRLRKFARRNRVVFTAAIVVAVALVAGTTVAIAGLLEARQQRDAAVLRAYVVDMNAAQRVWEDGSLQQAQMILRKYFPHPGGKDLRGFEWHYLWNLCQDESRFSFTNFPGPTHTAISPDGGFVAAGTKRIIRLLDYSAQREIGALTTPSEYNSITALTFQPGETNRLVTAHGSAVLFWDLAAHHVVSAITLSNPAVCIAMSLDGSLLATASGNQDTVALWHVPSRTLRWSRPVTTDVYAVAFTPEQKALISGGGESCEPLLWDLGSGVSSAFPPEHMGIVNAIAFTPDQKSLATSSTDSSVLLWSFPDRKLLTRFSGGRTGEVGPLTFMQDGKSLLAGSDDSTIRLWDVEARIQVAVYRGHRSLLNDLHLSPDGRTFVSSSADGTVKIWNVQSAVPQTILATNMSMATTALFSPEGKHLVGGGFGVGAFTVWDTATMQPLANLPKQETRGSALAAFSPKGKLFARIMSNTVDLCDGGTFAVRSHLTNGFDAISVSFSPDSKVLAAAGLAFFNFHGITNRLALWDVATRQRLNKLSKAAPFAIMVAFSHDGKYLAIGYNGGQVRVWDYATERLIHEFTDQHNRIWALAFSPNDSWLVAGGEEGTVVFYDVRAGRTFRSIATSNHIVGVSFSPDGRTVASAEGDGTIKLWNLATREVALILRGHVGAVKMILSFSPDGQLLASAGADGTLRLWPAPRFTER